MTRQEPPWTCPAAIGAVGGGSGRERRAWANHWKRWDAKPGAVADPEGTAMHDRLQSGKPQETAGRKAMGAKARRRYAGPAANYEKQTGGNPGAQSYGD